MKPIFKMIPMADISAEIVMKIRRGTGLGVLEAKQFCQSLSPPQLEKYLCAIELRGPNEHLLRDPIEYNPEFNSVFEAAKQTTFQKLAHLEQGRGYCHLFWRTLQAVLREEHGIEWQSPREMNPGTIFD